MMATKYVLESTDQITTGLEYLLVLWNWHFDDGTAIVRNGIEVKVGTAIFPAI